jgi:DNA-binding response OmpR family regulator
MTEAPSDQSYLLLIEDDDDHAELTEFYLRDHLQDMQVARLDDGSVAMQYLQAVRSGEQPRPWLIVLDLKLPKFDGHEILSYIKSDARLSRIPVVIFTTSNSSRDISLALENHANSYITKPMEPDGYDAVISRMIGYWKLNQHSLVLADTQADT